MTLVDRVAEALCIAERGETGLNGCRECQLDWMAGHSEKPKNCAGLWREAAIAALKAMKNPPPSIKARGAKAIFNNQDLAHDVWDQMIDEAIREAEQ